MSIRKLSPALQKKAIDELGEVPSRIPDDIKAIKDWLDKQPYIIANMDDQWILTFLRGCKFSLERTKEKLDYFYTAKSLAPDITMPADPADKSFQKYVRMGSCVALPKPVTEDGVHILIFQPGVCDPNIFTIYQNLQLNQMITEVLLLESDNLPIAGVKILADMKDVTLGHLSQLTIDIMRKLALSGEKALPIRQKGGHYLNTPSWIETVFNILHNFISEKLRGRLYVHNQDYEELYKHIPRECLPTEYGGDAGPIQDMADYWADKLLSHREYFLKCKKFKTDETKRPGKPKSFDEIHGVDGSFRAMNFD